MTVKSAHARVLEQLIHAHRQLLLDGLARGVDQNTYWKVVGQIEGLQEALGFSDRADATLNGED